MTMKFTRHAVARLLPGLCLVLIAQVCVAGQWGRNYFPNVELVNQDGKVLRFYDDVIKDKVVSINFMYTSCTDVCPVETAKLREMQRRLGDMVGRDVFMYSISIDPEHDTPEVLKAYAEQFHVGPGWQFLTGKQADIDELQKRLGLYVQSRQEIDPLDHNISLVLGNERTGRWLKRTPYDNPVLLADTLGYQLRGNIRNPSLPDYATARHIENFDRGDYLFRTRCASCHSIGGGNEIGPDLINVANRRDRAWLKRWIREPDAMLAENDPIATALVKQFKGLPMPNLSLNEVDAEALVTFLERHGAPLPGNKAAARPQQTRGSPPETAAR